MWGIGAIRDGAAGLVKQGAGAVRQGVEAGAKLLENLDEVGKNRFRHRQCFCWFRHVDYTVPPFPVSIGPYRCSGSPGSPLVAERWEGRLLHWFPPLRLWDFMLAPSFSNVDRGNPGRC